MLLSRAGWYARYGTKLTVTLWCLQVAYATTVGIRFINNVIGGENFIDMARYFGVQ
jgi:hypothetical protein